MFGRDVTRRRASQQKLNGTNTGKTFAKECGHGSGNINKGMVAVNEWGLLLLMIIAGVWMSSLQRRIERLERATKLDRDI